MLCEHQLLYYNQAILAVWITEDNGELSNVLLVLLSKYKNMLHKIELDTFTICIKINYTIHKYYMNN